MEAVGAEIFSLMAFVVSEAHATDIALCESRWSLAQHAIALAGQSASTYFMDSGRPGARGPGGGCSDGGMPAPVVCNLPPRIQLGQFRSNNDEDVDDALAA